MKFVFTKEEVAHALCMSSTEFEQARSQLDANDFPAPIAGLHERWSIIDVINWVNRNTNKAASPSSFSDSQIGNRLN